jgi:HAD superfamily hydrolase (TIGR01509 family)
MLESIIIDWDGTLHDSMEAVFRAYSIISGKPLEVIRKLYKPDWRRFEKEAGIPRVSDDEWHRIYREQLSDAKLFPGAKEYLQKIKNDEYKTALVTSSFSLTVRTDLEKRSLSDIFDVIVTADDVKKLKPNPECLKIAVKKLDLTVPKCIFIGDTDADACAAKNIGMKFIGVAWGFHTPEVIRSVNGDKIANNFDELYNMTVKFK